MKKGTTLLTALLLLLCCNYFSSFGQSNYYLLVTVENSFSVAEVETHPEFLELKTSFDIHSVEQAFSNSKKRNLQQVFSFTCNCSYSELMDEINTTGVSIKQPELAQEIELLTSEPNDYHLAFYNDYSLELINALEAWEITTGSPDIIIGISDSNYDLNHAELQQKVNYVQPNLFNTNITHGTAVATTAAGATNNSIGKSSIGYNSRLSLNGMSYNGVLNARNHGARIVNLSWASGCFYVSYHQSIINELFEDGVIVVAAAGNGTTCNGPENLVYPAAYENVIAVTSIGSNFQHEKIEGNQNSTHQHNASVDISAPGYNVPLAFPNNGYGIGNGTSFAAPLVSGTIGLMLATNDALNPCEVEQILKRSATNIDSINEPYIGGIGAGALNAYEAVKLSEKFIPTQVVGEVIPDPNNPYGVVDIHVNGDAFIDSYYAEVIQSDTNGVGQVENTYDIYITYESGCVFKTSFKDSDAEFFNDSIVILPVEDMVLAAEISGESALITWSTESESNNSHFELLKSFDGINWERIHTENGVGFSTQRTEYSFSDLEKIRAVQYYQIHQYDFNGVKTTTDIVSLVGASVNQIHLYPNPCDNVAYLESSNDIRLVNMYTNTGELILTTTPQSGSVTIRTDHLRTGIYHLKIIHKTGETTRKKLLVN